jgi:steroid delta-isomerase-like uncharacterized protein
LQSFADAWNRHDVDALMSMMTTDCVFAASGGNAVDGERHEGQRAVRAAFAAVFEQYPDAHWGHARHFVTEDRGVSEWTFTGTRRDGKRVEVTGCDVFTFQSGRIAVKNSFRKHRPPID